MSTPNAIYLIVNEYGEDLGEGYFLARGDAEDIIECNEYGGVEIIKYARVL